MASWLVQRLLQAMLVVGVMTVIVFIGLHAIGNPIDILISPEADEAERLNLIRTFGFDQPLWRQYVAFIENVLKGDLGRSFVYNIPALQLIAQRMSATLELAFAALLIAVAVGMPLGLIAGLWPDTLLSRVIMIGSIVGFSLPTFWVGLMLIMLFSVHLGWLPSSGRGPTVSVLGTDWSFMTLEGLRHLVLPALNLALFKMSLVLRLTRAGVREVLPMLFVKFAHAKGLPRRRIVGVHVMGNILIPIVTVVALELGSTIAFSVVTENIFAWPGMGKLIVDSILVLDRPVIVAYLMMTVVMFVTINLIAEVVYRLLDPRVSLTGER